MSDTPRHSVSVAAAIFDDAGENVLLIQRRDNGQWEPPGGVLELEETIEEGVRREVREETGAEIEVGPLTGVYKNLRRGIVALVFRSTLAAPFASETPEAAQVRWWDLSELPEIMEEAYLVRITDASGARPAIRVHDGHRVIDENFGQEP